MCQFIVRKRKGEVESMSGTQSRARTLKTAGWLLALAVVLGRFSAAQNLDTNGGTKASSKIRRQILVSIPDRKLAVLEDGRTIRTFPVAVGASVSPSPTGEFQIVHRLTHPAYYHPGIVIGPGSGNPLGPRWIGLNQKGFGIHGTNQPQSIGHAASHGCIRLRNHDIEQLFEMVSVGDVVEIRSERDQQIAQIFGGAVGENNSDVAQADTAVAEAGGQ